MPIFGGKPKGINTQLLQDILNRGADTQTSIIQSGFDRAAPLAGQFEQRRTQLGRAFEEGANQRAQQFAQGLQNIESPDFVRQQQAKARELAFRNLPAAQQAIRENLAATGGLNRGVAIRALQQPVLQAAQQASDQGFQIQQQAAQRNIARQQQALDTIFNTGQGAALQRLGIDRETADVLLQTGRSDILDRAFKLAGIEAGRTQGLLDIEQLRQTQEIARDQAKRAQTGALLGSLGSLVGAGAGALTGNPFGAILGSSLGGQLGGLAGGGTQPLDLTGALTALALRPRSGSNFTPISQPIAPKGSTLIRR